MPEKDILIGTQLRVPDGSTISAKPCYLITLTEKVGTGKTAQQKRFIAVDLPTLQTSFIQTKGFYTEATEEEVLLNFKVILSTMDKDQMLELYLPWHSIISIRSLVFKAK